MTAPDTDQTVHTLARRFKLELLRDIGSRNFRTMLIENRKPEYSTGACASHNFCDANMTMLRAFKRIMNRQPAILDENPDPEQDQRDTDLWNAAWELCRETEFFTRQEETHDAA